MFGDQELEHGHTVIQVAAGQTVTADAGRSEVFAVHASRADVSNFAYQGGDLVVEFRDGTKLTIRGFTPAGGQDQLVFVDGEMPYRAEFANALQGDEGVADNLVPWTPVGRSRIRTKP
jgi:predicted acyl esterase